MHVTTATTVTTVTVYIYIYIYVYNLYTYSYDLIRVCVSENWVYAKNGPFNKENYDEP